MGVTTWKVRNQAAIKKKKAEQAKWLKKIRGAVETCAKGRSKSVRRRRSVGDKQVWIIGATEVHTLLRAKNPKMKVPSRQKVEKIMRGMKKINTYSHIRKKWSIEEGEDNSQPCWHFFS